MKRLGLRTRLTVLVALGAVLTLAVLVTAFNLLLRSSLDADADRVLEARAAAALETIDVRGGTIQVGETPDEAAPDAQVWIYSGRRAVERAQASTSLQRLADSLARAPKGHAENAATDTRLYAVPIVRGGRRVGTVVAALTLEPYERTASRALVASLIFVFVVLILIVLSTRLVVARALSPVARMTAEAATWSERDIDHRFNVTEPHDELTGLAATFDQMLDRLAASLRHEQRFSAEISHELRTPLSAILAEAELALRREREPSEYRDALTRISSRAAQLQRVLETLLMAERAEISGSRGTADAESVGDRALQVCSELARKRRLHVELVPPTAPVRVDVDSDTAERILTPVVENACRYGSSRVKLAVGTGAELVRFVVDDDGSGVELDEWERIFEPGGRGAAGSANGAGDGAGLGLALARRLARAVGGDVALVPSESGARFEVSVPLA